MTKCCFCLTVYYSNIHSHLNGGYVCIHHFVRLVVAGGWCWFVMREKYCWLVPSADLVWEKNTIGVIDRQAKRLFLLHYSRLQMSLCFNPNLYFLHFGHSKAGSHIRNLSWYDFCCHLDIIKNFFSILVLLINCFSILAIQICKLKINYWAKTFAEQILL